MTNVTYNLANLSADEVADVIMSSTITRTYMTYERDEDTHELKKDTNGKYIPVEKTETNPTESWEEFIDALYGTDEVDGKPVIINGLGAANLVKEFGGEGQGDQLWFVFSVADGKTTRLFKMDGYYASHYGGEYDGELTEVKPVDKIVTFYE